MAPIAEHHRRTYDAPAYAEMVERVQAVVDAHLPASAAVAVISRGDDALLALGPRSAVHFPRAANGAYAGHHPPDSAAAIAHLQELHTGGVRHLVVPATARWWLDHYDAFAEHLKRHWPPCADDDACAIFTFDEPAAPPLDQSPVTPSVDDAILDAPTAARARRLLDALLPHRCTVLLAGAGWEGIELPGREVQRLEHGTGPSLIAVEAHWAAGAPCYLVVPLVERMGWLGELAAAVGERHAPIAQRAHVAAVFDLRTPTTATTPRVPA